MIMKKSIWLGIIFFVCIFLYELFLGDPIDKHVIIKVVFSTILSSTLFYFLTRNKNKK